MSLVLVTYWPWRRYLATKMTVGFTFAIPAAALCILRHLESVASARNVTSTKEDKRRRQKFEAFMCFGIPMVFMALRTCHYPESQTFCDFGTDYIVQGHRFDLFEDFGCYPSVYFSVASILLIYVPPLVMSLTTFMFAGELVSTYSLSNIFESRYSFSNPTLLTSPY